MKINTKTLKNQNLLEQRELLIQLHKKYLYNKMSHVLL